MMQMLKRLEEVFEHQVFELCGPFETEEGQDYCVPYMMNDALEDYLILKNCRMNGEYVRDVKGEQTMQLAEEGNEYVMAVCQGRENAFVLRFEKIEESVKFYQYHEIGHFWVKGQEHWRQLVYIIGTIYDKYQYLGEEACNEAELNLLNLIEFAPFRAWSPIHEPLDSMYPTTYEGVELARKLALEVGDIEYAKWITRYEKARGKCFGNILYKMLLSPKREALYELIWKKVEEASSPYPKREYAEDTTREMERARVDVTQKLLEKGFVGEYPKFKKEDVQVLVMEEHPFTIMEWEHYKFRVQFMVSKCAAPIEQKRNSGFFKGRGRKGWIGKYESNGSIDSIMDPRKS